MIHLITSLVTGILSIYLLVQNGNDCHPVGIIAYVLLFVVAYEQLRPLAKSFSEWAEKEFNNIVKEEKKEIDIDEDIII